MMTIIRKTSNPMSVVSMANLLLICEIPRAREREQNIGGKSA
jgi:hypothetical protein